MKSDNQIQKDVMDQLKWEPFLQASVIGVAVKNGIVTLSGNVSAYSKKLAAEKAAKKIAGVKAIVEDIQISLTPCGLKTDTEIAETILNALKWHTAVEEDKIKIKVENGNVLLEGEVEWAYERSYAAAAIENLAGVQSVLNLITIKPTLTVNAIHQKISAAFYRSATIDAGKISVEVSGSKVTLSGTVRSIAEIDDAVNTAWNAPGVISVKSRIEIGVPEHFFVD